MNKTDVGYCISCNEEGGRKKTSLLKDSYLMKTNLLKPMWLGTIKNTNNICIFIQNKIQKMIMQIMCKTLMIQKKSRILDKMRPK